MLQYSFGSNSSCVPVCSEKYTLVAFVRASDVTSEWSATTAGVLQSSTEVQVSYAHSVGYCWHLQTHRQYSYTCGCHLQRGQSSELIPDTPTRHQVYHTGVVSTSTHPFSLYIDYWSIPDETVKQQQRIRSDSFKGGSAVTCYCTHYCCRLLLIPHEAPAAPGMYITWT